MKKMIIEVIIVGFIALLSIIPIAYYLSHTPKVLWSYTQDKCIKMIVIENGKEVIKDCSDIPERYERIWVK